MGLFVLLSSLLLAATPAAVPTTMPPCDPIAGWEQVIGSEKVRFIVLGEMHGTNEVPAIFADAVCLTAETRRVVVAVEQPAFEQGAIDDFLSSDGGPAAKRAFLGAQMWHGSMKDGRSSEASFRLFETLRQWKAAGRIAGVVAMQPSNFSARPTPAEYEKAMADLVAAAAGPDAIVLALTGNVHARRSEVPWGDRYLPMAAHLPRESTVTLDVWSAGGEAWNCTGPTTCGPNPLQGPPNARARGVELGAAGDAYSGVLHLGAPATASPPQSAEPAPTASNVQRLQQEGKLMPALALAEQLAEANPATIGALAQYWSFTGDLATADALYARSMGPVTVRQVDLSQARPEPAIEAIVRAARGRRIVMINEAHHAPHHRAFVHKLMLALRAEGFTHFAAEAFCSWCSELLTNGAPTIQTGFYLSEPVFGDLARRAGAVGYTLVGYEIRPGQYPPPETPREEYIAIREQAQADNLAAALATEPDARVLVHVGFGHLNEASSSTAMFAARLKQATGVDPLTIDQNEGTRQHSAEYDSSLYRAFVAAFGEPAAPVVIANDPQRPLGGYAVDLSVIHPTRREVGDRPDWMEMGGYRKPYPVALAPLGERSLVRAFVASEPADAIAMDQMLVQPGAEAVTLMLPAGDYRLVRQTESGEDRPLGELTTR